MTIVLLHGYLESLDVWDEFTNLLIPYMRVIALDLPGHGISEVKGEIHTMEFLADTVYGVLQALNVNRCVIAGHSMGGYVALEFLRKYPDMLSGFRLLHSTPNPDSEQKKSDRQREIDVVLSGKKDLLAESVSKGFAADNRKHFADVIEDLKEQAYMTEEDGIIALLRGMCERKDNNETLSRSAVPELLIFGKKDEHISMETAETIVGKNPQAKIVWLENSGHTGFVEEPEKSAKAIIEFCESLDW